jgi:hypothetical protein
MKITANFIIMSSWACIIACFGEFAAVYVFGHFYPGYNHLKETMSQLGASKSPVSVEISIWWIMMGVLFILFAIGIKMAFIEKGAYAKIASWLIILYALGEGIGSGVFKADHLSNGLTTSAIIHNITGGIGIIAILLFPLIMQKVITKIEMPAFHCMSKIIFISDILISLLFLSRYLVAENSFLSLYKGLWQRLFMLNTYVYLAVIAILMIRNQQLHDRKSSTT